MAEDKKTASKTPDATGSQQVDPRVLVNALNNAEGQVRELTDLVTRLNRSLRQLEEQNQQLAQRLQALQVTEE
jgi:predicted RNase H-like nuclease (RuvC/YqgF family)